MFLSGQNPDSISAYFKLPKFYYYNRTHFTFTKLKMFQPATMRVNKNQSSAPIVFSIKKVHKENKCISPARIDNGKGNI